ncbi:MAG: hypothetical protein LBV27_10325 [Oscillospiraceae bacterium]|jgi:hypothetical protein|nr:hypothetical protein [Oscillospiraceae bacterium]
MGVKNTMSNDNGNKDKDGIITDKAELEKLLKQQKTPVIGPVKNLLKNTLLGSASCYLTGPPIPDFKPNRGGKRSILDQEVMCYLTGPRDLDEPEDIDLPDVSDDQDNGDDDQKDDGEKDNNKKDDDFDGIVTCYHMTE